MTRWFWRIVWAFRLNRLTYCEGWPCACETNGTGFWTLCREQSINRSTASAWMCRACAEEEQVEVGAAWAEYYSGCL